MSSILVINGPNLNLLGSREPGVYGTTTLEDIERLCAETAGRCGLQVACFQSNHEGAIIDAIHDARDRHRAIVINPGAYTHTSVAIRDAIAGVGLPAIEVHLSNIHARERFRHHSHIAPVAVGQITGLGPKGYVLAIEALADIINKGG
ncbi:MAG: type II 3-dehydroquinate dehydratase [Alphaproteobacteria bacterium]|nr:MAG: type II 3-dehydroquinate dehydratase [Alphaproteobacteria bacterium]